MKNLYFLIILFFALLFSQALEAQSGCTTCALAEIIGDDWKDPTAGGNGTIYATYGWKFNLRNRYGRKIVDEELAKIDKKLNKPNVQKVQRLVTQYASNGWLNVMIIPHRITLKSGEPYFLYQEYITGLTSVN